MLIRTDWKRHLLVLVMALSASACTKPDQSDPSLTPDPTPTPQITVSTSSQPIFSNGLSFNAGEQTSDSLLQTSTVGFHSSMAWTASVDATKAVDWLLIEPSSGGAGDVTMKVSAQPNDTFEERTAKVTIKSGSASESFSVKQAGKQRPVEVTSITLDKTELSLTEGETVTLTATVAPDNAADKTVIWNSSNPAVATVDETGKVEAVAAGEATITAKAGEKTATCMVTVKAKEVTPPPTPEVPAVVEVASISLNETNLILLPGGSATLTATVSPENAIDKSVTWSSSNPAVATVDAQGTVTAVAVGKAVITAKAGEKQAECKITVNPIPVSSLTLDKSELELKVGENVTLVATVNPENATNKNVTWSSSNPAVATVDAQGTVTAIAVGEAVITAKAGEKLAECKVTVNPIPVSSLTLDKSELELKVGENVTLIATVSPENATNKTISWSSSNTAAATVDSAGSVTAIALGEAVITAQIGEISATCSVKVLVPGGGIEGTSTSQETP